MDCGADGKLVGLYGRAGTFVDRLGGICSIKHTHANCISQFNTYSFYVNLVNNLNIKIKNKENDIKSLERELVLVKTRLSDMRTVIKNGVNKMLKDYNISLNIPNFNAEPWKYLSYDNSYILEM